MNNRPIHLCHGLVAIACYLPSVTFAEDWIGLDFEPKTILGYSYMLDQDDSDSHQFSLYHPLGLFTDINLLYSRNSTTGDSQTFDYDGFTGQLSWQSTENTKIGLSYQYQGKQQELEIQNIGILGSYSPLPFSLRIEYRLGELDIFTRENINNRSIPDQIDSDIDSQHITLSWFYDDYSLYLNHERYHYQKNLRALSTRPFLQFAVKPGVLANSGLILNSVSTAGFSLFYTQRELNWSLARTTYEIDNSSTLSLQFDWREVIEDLNIIYSASANDDDEDNLSVGIGFEWNV